MKIFHRYICGLRFGFFFGYGLFCVSRINEFYGNAQKYKYALNIFWFLINPSKH